MKLGRGEPARLLRHQAGALVATGVDFLTTVLLVWAGLSAVLATVCGAALGAVVNFSLGRRWIFQASGAISSQAQRYALVSLGSLLLNAAGEGLLVHAGVHFFVGRVIVAVTVSLLWNYPLQRRFVFKGA
jgi:putative flippase GtrA